MERLRDAVLAPYIQLATTLIGRPRRCGGNMFRHQMDTLGILIDYGYVDPVVLKAAIIHDLIEDEPGFKVDEITKLPEGEAVLSLVREVSKTADESKAEFLIRIRRRGSPLAKVLKVADRLSNMIGLGLVNDLQFIKRYILETALYVYPIAEEVNEHMARELRDLISSRMDLLVQRPVVAPVPLPARSMDLPDDAE
jgi:(p)ppGpp synthase/HD superfamily hydrolase